LAAALSETVKVHRSGKELLVILGKLDNPHPHIVPNASVASVKRDHQRCEPW